MLDIYTPGEQPFEIDGPAGRIEGILSVPDTDEWSHVTFLGHPHPLHGGTMTNKVITTTAKAFKECGIPSVRFNFRGVGKSEGVHDHGLGESQDMLFIVEHIQLLLNLPRPIMPIFAGFSFGSYVTYLAAAKHDNAFLISIAPPVHHCDYTKHVVTSPWYIIQGEEDDVVPPEMVLSFAQNHKPPLPVTRFETAGHFFHGHLVILKDSLIGIISQELAV